MKKLVLALAGVWHVHIAMFLEALSKQYGDVIEWRYVWDDHKENAVKFGQMLGAKQIDDFDEALADPEVTAIICEARSYLHKDLLIRAIRAGKHIYTDKPCAITVEDVLEIKEALDYSSVKYTISHESIPTAPHQYAKKLIEEGKLGKIVSMYFRRAHWFAKPLEEQMGEIKAALPEDWFTPSVSGGGALLDLGIHGVSIMEYFLGKATKVFAFTQNYTGHESEDSASFMMRFANGAIGTVHADMVTSIIDNNLEIIGTDGILSIVGMDGTERVLLQSYHDEAYKNGMTLVDSSVFMPFGRKLPLCQFIDLVCDEENTERHPEGLGIDEAVDVIKTLAAAYQSVKEGKPVRID